jgi:plasmid stabilization system protein ParE
VNFLIVISPAAELDLAETRDWYDAIRAGLSRDFELAFDATLCTIARHPEAFGTVSGGLRRALLQRFPHAVFYRLTPAAAQIVAVLHTNRDPRIWQSRQH